MVALAWLSLIVIPIISAFFHFTRPSPHFERFKQFGDPSNPPVVLIPGLDGCTSFFADVIPELTPKFHVVVFNLPLADEPFRKNPNRTEPYSFQYMAGELVSVMEELGLPEAYVVGESFGGVIAQRLAIDYPRRVKKLVVLSSLAKTEMPPEVAFKAKYLLPVVETLGLAFPGLAQTLFAYLHVDDVIEPHEPEWVKQFFKKEASWAHHYSVMARLKLVIPLNMAVEVGYLPHKVLIIYGQDDHFTRKGSEHLHQIIQASEIVAMPGGHLPHVTSPKLFAELVENFIVG
uniref:AB hydrolase-1 domain-containing protein n=1 Tax=Fibrocapsa japonica TaxID=94617 RepID=A0A7S2XZC0_9STRA|mmetsp:Transcript_24034/g.34911  ORF Transcript_24034/g.34911 Transcript_24034/m.34911 type:complete len:289 (+) Transcript_24034:59-925(+)|eukprot:CAMPEP_0113944606 /NCGR_PEP_ID=MMETSP1339-20121228/34813_1 /TAXON_ID=94617 /ORGANISM="Fibrocapsa japonica" /LENGTH=288 /DNA_ID=CAMNT_0000949871 /DNA_START=41 /DNA_END=907 /DNA_ORIENTATION=+ /assembly_acc=CAM_ASM_000762